MAEATRLHSSMREKVWGRQKLSPWFRDSPVPIGEAWYLADGELPLLVKLLFTSERLSVQVHPDDGEDGPRGKTEMWHILEAEPGASIALGFREPISREQLLDATRTGEVEHLLNWIEVKPGETYFTPAHTVHAIGAGVMLCEIQQNSDVTYRLWDYGRPREIHVEKAVAISDLTVHPGAVLPRLIAAGWAELVRAKHFVTELVELASGTEMLCQAARCQLWICLAGLANIGGRVVLPGEVWMMPDEGSQPVVVAEASCRFLRTYVPAK